MQCAFRVLEVETKNRESRSKIPLFLPEHVKQNLVRDAAHVNGAS